jgi:hypothetical protein
MTPNPSYTQEKVVSQIKEVLSSEGSVQLGKFLTEESFKQLLQNVETLSADIVVDKEPLTHSYKKAPMELSDEMKVFFSSLGLTISSAELRVFTWKDYLLIQDKIPVAVLDVSNVSEWDEKSGGEFVIRDDDGNASFLPVSANMLGVVTKDFYYVNYCTHYGKEKERKLVFFW